MRYLLLLVLLGCSGAPYSPYSSFTRKGFKDKKLSSGKYQVAFYGDGNNTPMEVHELFLRRSAEIAKQDSKQGFCVTRDMPGAKANGPVTWFYHEGIVMLTDSPTKKDCHFARDILPATP